MNTNKLHWNSSVLELASNKKPSQSLLKLFDAGIKTVKDLTWIFPLRIQKAPKLLDFNALTPNKLFLGKAKLIHINFTPAFGRRGKGKVQLFNATCVVKDSFSEKYLNLKWFNTYPGLRKQLENMDEFTFMGKVDEYRGTLQIVNPQINPSTLSNEDQMLIEYPTVNSVSGINIKKIINKIPNTLWEESSSELTNQQEEQLKIESFSKAINTIHGKLNVEENEIDLAKERLIYEEFYVNQLKIMARKLKYKKLTGHKFESKAEVIKESLSLFPYTLTDDQLLVFEHIQNDLKSGHPMMRMIQGDVGCGKTTVAILAAMIVIEGGGQVAFMCPTEALALQHADTIANLLGDKIDISVLLGSTKVKNKAHIYENLEEGKIDLIIGTHSLFQDSVKFKNLSLAIIDEQHKFGVEQRQKLIDKGESTHTLIMTATPIPRTLQLAQYGDLNISTIHALPQGRKGIKTRIVNSATYQKYLSFIKTRMSIGEQVYIVVPAIEESEIANIKNVNGLAETYKKYFPEYNIATLHGQLKPQEKQDIMNSFSNGDIDLLISTTVIEVGINVINSTVISIYNPDRFGLSSLHQLRGRVGRGEKAGFCFLITDKHTSQESLDRIKIIEKTIDGFEIAEADLKNRGQGDLFGVNQSGHISSFKIANLIEHFPVFEKVSQDIESLRINQTEYLNNILLKYLEDSKVSSTI